MYKVTEKLLEGKRWKIKSRQMLVTVASELRMVIVMSAIRIGAIRMKNKEKYSKKIVELACDGNCIAVDKNSGKVKPC